MMCLKRWNKRQSGQAMVETAIVLPLFVFMVLGTIQLTLIIQAKSMTKYAAYRAARAGAMNGMDMDRMQKEAFVALSPVISGSLMQRLRLMNGRPTSSTKLMLASMFFGTATNRYTVLPVVNVRICGPVKSWLRRSIGVNGTAVNSGEIDFDDPRNTFDSRSASELNNGPRSIGERLEKFERTRLRVQVEYNHNLIIPFANWIFYNIWRDRRIPATLRMGEGGSQGGSSWLSLIISAILTGQPDYWEMERKATGTYTMPLVENYAFRMQSNFNMDALPDNGDECISYRNPRTLPRALF